jgi:hypothetical protein
VGITEEGDAASSVAPHQTTLSAPTPNCPPYRGTHKGAARGHSVTPVHHILACQNQDGHAALTFRLLTRVRFTRSWATRPGAPMPPPARGHRCWPCRASWHAIAWSSMFWSAMHGNPCRASHAIRAPISSGPSSCEPGYGRPAHGRPGTLPRRRRNQPNARAGSDVGSQPPATRQMVAQMKGGQIMGGQVREARQVMGRQGWAARFHGRQRDGMPGHGPPARSGCPWRGRP